MDIDGELTVEKSLVSGFLSPKHLHLIVLPTENCNFRCTYCYEDFEIGKMSRETIDAAKQLMMKRLPKLDSFQLAWFGGEPLMAKEIVMELGQFAQAESARLGVNFTSSMTTNAFALNPETFSNMLGIGVRHFQISLDGEEEQHNKTRKLMNGKGTFARIWEHLLLMRENPEKFKIVLRVHVHGENIDSVRQLLGNICAAFGDDDRFVISLKAVWNGGGEGVKSMNLIKTQNEIMSELEQQVSDSGWHLKRASANPDDGGKRFTPCYAALPNSLVVRANGAINKCTVAFSDPRNAVGVLNNDGSVSLNRDMMKVFMRGFESMDETTMHCPMTNMPKLNPEKVIKFVKKPELMALAA